MRRPTTRTASGRNCPGSARASVKFTTEDARERRKERNKRRVQRGRWRDPPKTKTLAYEYREGIEK
jgi:hypothetical protein